MTLLDQRPTADRRAGTDAEALFKEARRRRRRLRLLWVVIALALVGCVVGIGFGFHVLSRPSIQSRSAGTGAVVSAQLHTGVTLVYAFNDLRVIDADTGATRTLPMPASYGGSGDLGMVHVGGSLLLNRGNTAWLYPNGVAGSPRSLGPSDGVFWGPTRNEAWIWSQPCQPAFGCADYRDGPRMGSMRLVDGSGATIVSPVQLPRGWYPTGVAGHAGIVLRELPAYGNAEEIWNPLTEHVVRLFLNEQVIGAAGNHLVSESSRDCSGGSKPCSLRLTDLKTGSDQTVVLPKRAAVVGGATFSPDRRTIAVPVALRPGRTGFRGPHREAIAVIDVRTGDTTVLPGSQQPTNPSYTMSLTWSSNGWLLFSDTVESSVAYSGFSDTIGWSTVRVWHQGDLRARVLPNVRLPKAQLGNEDPSLIAL